MSIALSERYLHYDITEARQWQVVQPSALGVRALNLARYQQFLRNEYKIAAGTLLEALPEDIELAGNAAAFIEQTTGLKVTCSLGKYTELHGATDGIYNPGLHQVAVRRRSHGSEYGDTISFGCLLVHEMMHSTAIETAKVLELQDGDSRDVRTLQPHHIAEITPSFTGEFFFEEGLCEEIASRWRMQFDPRLQQRDRDLLAFGDRSSIPLRMYSSKAPIDSTRSESEREICSPVYCAFGIQLLSEYTGVDLIDLLIQARKPATQVSASERLKQAVDYVEPGLYDVLASARYTLDDFEDGLHIIKEAIAGHAHSIQ